MIPNIKLDIVYYLTATDFEMEFNLGGCCRMRMLTDRVSDKKTYVKSLSRAVSRSKIIIACGPLFGEEGLIYITSKAIGANLVTADNSEYGIEADSEIKIMENSVPLVTRSGIFGGCIIESGPQTIILLTENRDARKDIMKNLIHPYIEETSLLEATRQPQDINPPPAVAPPVAPAVQEVGEQAEVTDFSDTPLSEEEPETGEEENEGDSQTTEEAPASQQDEASEAADTAEAPNEAAESRDEADSVSQAADSAQETLYDSAAEAEDVKSEIPAEEKQKDGRDNFNNISFVFDDDYTLDAQPKDDSEHKAEFDFITEPEQAKRGPINRYAQSEEDVIPVIHEDKLRSSNHRGINISIIVISVLLLIIAAALCYILIFLPHSKGMSVTEYLSDIMTASEPVKNLIIR